MENENMVVQQKKNSPVFGILISIILIAGAGIAGWYIGQMNSTEILKEKTECEEKLVEAKKTSKKEATATRVCEGKYVGEGAVSIDIQTNKTTKGKITIELTKEGTFTLSREGSTGDTGKYVIVDGNVLLLKISPHTTGGSADTTPKTSEYLKISEDCSTISDGYGSYFFDPNFTLTKQN